MALRLFLLTGLVLHKLVWEVLRRRQCASTGAATRRAGLKPVKAAKVAILGGLLLQTLFLTVFPIARRPGVLRWGGAALYLVGLTTALVGRIQLGRNWANVEDRGVLAGQELVTHGIYAHVRHPIYSGDTLLVIGLQLALNSWLFVFGLPLFLFVHRQALQEEQLLAAAFCDYEPYRQRTRRFIPLLL
jgi:protein-S-isoprenylcysteine O-methyltransferase Ste14